MAGIIDESEGELGVLSELCTAPGLGECLLCYVYRLSADPGCDGTLRWAQRWRDLRAPRAKALERQLAAAGGYCDCEIFMNGWTASSTITRTHPQTGPSAYDEDDDVNEDEDEIWPDPMPSCNGVPPRSTESCSLWSPRQRGPW
jgi:hypothetical protein